MTLGGDLLRCQIGSLVTSTELKVKVAELNESDCSF